VLQMRAHPRLWIASSFEQFNVIETTDWAKWPAQLDGSTSCKRN